MPKLEQPRFKPLRFSTRSYGVMLLCCLVVAPIYAEHEGPWTRHTIDNTSRGADGVRLDDANGDGFIDIVTGWEEGGITRLYLNPGPKKAKDKWPAVTVGKTPNVEDAVMVDLDGDSAIDVVSSCEGKTKTIFVHWGPKDKTKLLDPDAWQTEPIPATVGRQMWMYCLPTDVNADGRQDMITGSKGKGAAVGWLESPDNLRDLQAWRYHKVYDAGWIMSLHFNDWTDRHCILVTDRVGPSRGAYVVDLIEPGRWNRTDLELGKAQYMFGDGGHFTFAVATRDGFLQWFTDPFAESDHARVVRVPNPFGTKAGKAVAIGTIDADVHDDLVVSFNTQNQKDKPGVAWIKVLPDKDPKDWPAYNIAGPEGKKFDRIELIDLDGDGDLDVLTCEEADNLGVIWYENPYGP